MCRPAGVGSAGLRPAAGPGVMPLGTVRSLRLTAVSTSRSAPLSYDARAPLSSHRGVRVPTGCLAGPASEQRQRGQRGPGVRMACGTLCALYPCGNLRNPIIAAVFRSSLASCRDCRANRTWAFGGWHSKQGMGQLEGKGDEAPSAGRCPKVVEVRTWIRRAGGYGNVESSSTDRGGWHRIQPPSAEVNQGMTGSSTAAFAGTRTWQVPLSGNHP